ncbi:MAG: LOG family protein [Chloroflexi bacterium]|nr:LOG family protein [Chloroflexota bacterium]
MTVGVMGSSGGHIAPEVFQKAYRLGQEVARRGYVLVTGACPGLPHESVKGAKSIGGVVVGVSPALNLEEHVLKFQSPTWGYDALIFTGSGLMGREIENIRSCNIVVFAGGRSGTLGEFAIAYDEGKIIGILESTGGITVHLKTIISFIQKETGATILSGPDPADLLDRLEEVYRARLLPRYQDLVAGRDPHGVMEQ